MQLGPVRFFVEPKSQAAQQPFEHRLIVRETRFRLVTPADGGIQRIYRSLASGPMSSTNSLTADWEREEGTSFSKRDFTGHDFTAWVYDLFRPDEPYQARGIHPSGVGIRRYIRESDLSPAEKSYLRRQGFLAGVNLLDPNLYGGYGFKRGGRAINLSAAHSLTPFGYSIDINTFLIDHNRHAFVVLHAYRNHERTWPGIEIETETKTLSPRVAIWLQPSQQLFRDRRARFGGLAALRLRRGKWYAEAEAKSAGWISGNVHLNPAAALRVGVVLPSHNDPR